MIEIKSQYLQRIGIKDHLSIIIGEYGIWMLLEIDIKFLENHTTPKPHFIKCPLSLSRSPP